MSRNLVMVIVGISFCCVVGEAIYITRDADYLGALVILPFLMAHIREDNKKIVYWRV